MEPNFPSIMTVELPLYKINCSIQLFGAVYSGAFDHMANQKQHFIYLHA